jgi:hypothetical protein
MAQQSAGNVLAAFKRETTFGTEATGGAGAYQLPVIDSPGLKLTRGSIESARRPSNLIARHARLGGKSVTGSYNAELIPGGAQDMLLESALRGTWLAAVDSGAVTVSTTTSTIVRTTGSFLTNEFKSGDIITIAGDATTANNGLRLRVASVTALVMTVSGTPLTLNAATRSVTITRLKKVMNPAVPVYHSYTVEQREVDIDEGELFRGVRLTNLALSLRPNAMSTAAYTFMGVDRRILSSAQSPYYTSPADPTGLSIVADDSWIRYNGTDIVAITGLDLSIDIASAITPTIGAITPTEVFMNIVRITASLTAIRESLGALTMFDAETEFEISVLLTTPGVDPDPCLGIYLPSVKITDIDAPFLGGDGAKVETRALSVSGHAGDTDTDAAAVIFYSSAA